MRARTPLAALALTAALSGLAGAETRTVVAGAKYRASGLHKLFFGSDYRALWATPIEVEVLDLGSFASGLKPVRRVGGLQTKSLAMRGGDGRAYTFRSLDKDPSAALPADLQGTIATQIIRDQTSGGHPAGALVASSLLAAADVLASHPQLVVMPDDPALGEFRETFAGVLGTIEEFPVVGFHGAAEVLSSADARARFAAGPADRPDTRAFLRIRLVDLLIGDWDRHRAQWRWARFPDRPLWVPLPEDRDQAFARYEGVFLGLARASLPKLVVFGPRYPNLEGLTMNGWEHDRTILSDLEWSEWERIATDLQRRLSDEAIDAAIASLPAPYVALDGPRMRTALRSRRNGLLDVARRFYSRLSRQLDVYLTDAAEEVTIVHGPGGVVDLSIRASTAEAPYLQRRLHPDETHEVRIYLRGGDDRVSTQGRPGPITVRAIGGPGQDRLDDSRGGGTRFADTDVQVIAGPGTDHDARPYTPPVNVKYPLDPPRDWGSWTVPIPWMAASPDLGLFAGGGFTQTRFGFRKHPVAAHHLLRAGWATTAQNGKIEYTGLFQGENTRRRIGLTASASGIEILHFHGFGNETEAARPKSFYEAKQQQVMLAPTLHLGLGRRATLSLGPIAHYARTDLEAGQFITISRPYGSDTFGQAGGAVALAWDSHDRDSLPLRGVSAVLEGRAFPAVWDAEDEFASVRGETSAAFTAFDRVTLAVRAGAKKVFGRYPFHEAAFIGGGDSVRGFSAQRFAGDAAAWGNAEVRAALTRFFFILPGELGVFALADAGRVFLEGESSSRWHSAVGGGIWISVLSRRQTMSLAIARSDEGTAAYLRGGMSF